VIYIIVLNWNGWRDTLECLQSLLALRSCAFRIVVCDNCSNDDSLAHIGDWIDSLPRTQVFFEGSHRTLDTKSLGTYQSVNAHTEPDAKPDPSYRFSLIQTGSNLGYGAGNNVGIRFALQDPQAHAVWILNNDVVVEPNSLVALERYSKTHPQSGIIGSKLMFYDRPTCIQAVGGRLNTYFATSSHLGQGEEDLAQYDHDLVVKHIDYPVGAALFVPRSFIESVGLLSEKYFLYFEEIDWVLRGKVHGWQIGYCWQSTVFHKEGASAGSHANARLKSALSDHYSLINRVIFTRNFYPGRVWVVKLGLLIAALNRIRRGQFERLFSVTKALVS
jgi:GT2 family glycosyltransferase